MADAVGAQDIRGLDVDKLVKGFADEQNILKKFTTQSTTKAREIRWFQKTAGFLDVPDTTGITLSWIPKGSERALPFIAGPTWTRNTSYVKKFFVESETLSIEDIKDSDVDVLATTIRDLVRGVQRQVDARIYAVLAEAAAATPATPNPTNTLTTAAVADGWDDAVTGNPVKDILVGKRKIRAQGYDPEGAILLMNPIEHEFLLDFLISVKGSSIPQFASDKVASGVVMEILGQRVVVSENATTDWVVQFVPQRALTWKGFMPITSVVVDDPGIGKKVRVWEEGECLLTDPKCVHWISDTTV